MPNLEYMKKSIKPNLDDYDNGKWLKIYENPDVGAMELSEYIENLIDNTPRQNNKHSVKPINLLIDKFNAKFGKIYKKVR